jgi:hypothetical protein
MNFWFVEGSEYSGAVRVRSKSETGAKTGRWWSASGREQTELDRQIRRDEVIAMSLRSIQSAQF